MERNRPNKRLFVAKQAFVLLILPCFALTVLGAAAQQCLRSKHPCCRPAPATTQQPSTQAPACRLGSAAQSQAAPDQQADWAESVHMVVGHSLLIRTPSRIKRILTGNPAVIESVLTSPRELVITAKPPGGSSLMLWDETGTEPHLGCVRGFGCDSVA